MEKPFSPLAILTLFLLISSASAGITQSPLSPQNNFLRYLGSIRTGLFEYFNSGEIIRLLHQTSTVLFSEFTRTRSSKLFVFGDSYADTGNWNKSVASSWKPPYGITFPGKPTGRFSDGRILADYIASYMHIRSPIPYEQRKTSGTKELRSGMNFAYGGTGVFDTDVHQPNLSTQIGFFRDITAAKVYTKTDLLYSVAFVSVAGNDYANFLKNGPPDLSLKQFTRKMIHQLVVDLKQIHSVGVPKVVVTALEPLGCLPAITFLSGYKNCSNSLNQDTAFHNRLLQRTLDRLNTRFDKPVFFMLDLYNAFLSVLQRHPYQQGNEGDYNPLMPCCQGINGNYQCGSQEGGVAKYTLCKDPKKAFFWDGVHPAQNGWYQVYQAIRPQLQNIL